MKRLNRVRKLFGFLREHRHELFDDTFQDQLEGMYRDTGAGDSLVQSGLSAADRSAPRCCGNESSGARPARPRTTPGVPSSGRRALDTPSLDPSPQALAGRSPGLDHDLRTSLGGNSAPPVSAHLWPKRLEHGALRCGCRSPAPPRRAASRRLRAPQARRNGSLPNGRRALVGLLRAPRGAGRLATLRRARVRGLFAVRYPGFWLPGARVPPVRPHRAGRFQLQTPRLLSCVPGPSNERQCRPPRAFGLARSAHPSLDL